MEIRIMIDNHSKDGKALLQYLQNLSFVEIVDEITDYKKQAFYDPKFVRKIRERERSTKTIRLNPENVWENILPKKL